MSKNTPDLDKRFLQMWFSAMKRSSLELGEERKGADELLKKLERRD